MNSVSQDDVGVTRSQRLVSGESSRFVDVPLGTPAGRDTPLQFSRRVCALILVVADIAAALLSCLFILLAAHLSAGHFGAFGMPRNLHATLVEFGLVFAALIAWLAAHGHYHKRQPFWRTLRQVMLATGVAVLCNGFIEYSFKTDTSRLVVIGTWLLFPFTLFAMRHLAIALLRATSLWTIRTVVVGNGPAVELVVDALVSERLGYEIVGIVGTDAARRGSGDDLLRHHRAQMLVLASDGGDGMRAIQETLQRNRQPFALMAPTHGLPLLTAELTCFPEQDLVMLGFAKSDAQYLARIGKAMLDLGGAAVLLVALSPLLAAIAVAVKLDGGPAFYAHTRIGAGRRRFGCLKFRSMRTDSEALMRELLLTNPAMAAEWAATQKLRHDPRVTPLGRVLRATSLDELPQLFNVLRGEMSLVGPRPIVDAEVAHYGQEIAYYYHARPGLTGLWQVSGRSDVGYGRRVQLDVLYVKNWTLWTDLAILCRTIPAVLKQRGAV